MQRASQNDGSVAGDLLELVQRFVLLHELPNHDHSDEAWRLNVALAKHTIARAETEGLEALTRSSSPGTNL